MGQQGAKMFNPPLPYGASQANNVVQNAQQGDQAPTLPNAMSIFNPALQGGQTTPSTTQAPSTQPQNPQQQFNPFSNGYYPGYRQQFNQ